MKTGASCLDHCFVFARRHSRQDGGCPGTLEGCLSGTPWPGTLYTGLAARACVTASSFASNSITTSLRSATCQPIAGKSRSTHHDASHPMMPHVTCTIGSPQLNQTHDLQSCTSLCKGIADHPLRITNIRIFDYMSKEGVELPHIANLLFFHE